MGTQKHKHNSREEFKIMKETKIIVYEKYQLRK